MRAYGHCRRIQRLPDEGAHHGPLEKVPLVAMQFTFALEVMV